jgi:hypothetical protein
MVSSDEAPKASPPPPPCASEPTAALFAQRARDEAVGLVRVDEIEPQVVPVGSIKEVEDEVVCRP